MEALQCWRQQRGQGEGAGAIGSLSKDAVLSISGVTYGPCPTGTLGKQILLLLVAAKMSLKK